MKKIIILLIALITGVAMLVYVYFSKLNSEKSTRDLALQSATNNAALIFSFQNDKSFYRIIEGQELLQQILGPEKTKLLEQLKSEFIEDRVLNGYLQDQQIYLSILPDEEKTLNFLLTVQVNAEYNTDQFYNQFKHNRSIQKISDHTYRILLKSGHSLYMGIQNQVITASTSLKLLDNAAIRLAENPFTEYIKQGDLQNKNILAHLYINFNQAPILLQNILAGNINGELSIFNKQDSYATLNYTFSKERVLFNGSTQLMKSENYLKLFENLVPQSNTLTNLLPSQTANYTLYAINDYPSWLNRLKQLQDLRQETNPVNALLKKIKADYGTDLSSIFPVYTKDQFVTFQLSTGEKLGAILLSNGEKVRQLLLDLGADYNDNIKLFKSPDILSAYFGDAFKKFTRPYYTIIDNYFVFANNASTVQDFLNDYQNNRLLINAPAYQDAMNQLSTSANVSYYIDLKNATDLFRNNIRLPFYKHLRADSGLKTFDTFYFQMRADKHKFITNLLLNKYLKPEVPDSLSNR